MSIERAHSTAELILAAWNHYCEKHGTHPDVCGATKQFRKAAGNFLAGLGVVLATAAILKAK